MKTVLILGAAGRDFHNFNVFFRQNLDYEVVAFTATQIPDIAGRRYPAVLAGRLYPEGIPIFDETAEQGAYFLGLLRSLRSARIKEVRGIGLWIGIELHVPARRYCEALKEEGVLCKETHDKVIRIAPPLIIRREEIDWAFERIRRVIEKG